MPRRGFIIGGGLTLVLFFGAPFAGVFGLMAFSSVLCAQPPAAAEDNQLTLEQYLEDFSEEEQSEQRANAELIVAIGIERELSTRSIQIAVATAIQESNLLNLDHGDRDSLGLFQQRPSAGWGTAEQILDPNYAINAFYDRLETVEDRDLRPMIDVAIEVQIPDPAAYERRWQWDLVAAQLVNGRSGNPESITPEGNIGCNAASSVGWVMPLDRLQITSVFGSRYHPVYHVWMTHNGVDFDGDEGDPIYAVHAGQITYVGYNGGLGNYVAIDHGGGIATGYGHMVRFADGLERDSFVQAGQVIGYVGTTGTSTGNHLHFEVKVNGSFVDPEDFMASIGLPLR